jgi:hypothetical protein
MNMQCNICTVEHFLSVVVVNEHAFLSHSVFPVVNGPRFPKDVTYMVIKFLSRDKKHIFFQSKA